MSASLPAKSPSPPSTTESGWLHWSAARSFAFSLLAVRRPRPSFLQAVTRARIQIEPIELLQIADLPERRLAEWALAVEGMQNNALQQIAQSQVVIFGKALQYLEQAFLDPHPGLHPLNQQPVISFVYHGTNVPWYQCGDKPPGRSFSPLLCAAINKASCAR